MKAHGLVAMISSFPDTPNRSVEKLNAVASYADHLAGELAKTLANNNLRLCILSDHRPSVGGDQKMVPRLAHERSYLVVRSWRKNRLISILKTFAMIVMRKRFTHVLVQFEFNMYGNMLVSGMIPWMCLFLKMAGRKPVLLTHQVLLDIGDMSGHVNLGRSRYQRMIYNGLLRLFYRSILACACRVIVHEEVLKRRLISLNRSRPVSVIPHGLGEYAGSRPAVEARKRLSIPQDKFVVLCFGYVTWYKGSDWVVDLFIRNEQSWAKRYHLIIGGGRSANMSGKAHYVEFYERIMDAARKNSHITLTGYLDDDGVVDVFSAADVVVLPYRTQMSASGPLAVAFSLGKPVLLADSLKGNILMEDLQNALLAAGVSSDNLFFSLDGDDLGLKLDLLYRDRLLLERMCAVSRSMLQARSWSKIAVMMADTICGRNDRAVGGPST